jgi:hypothetical protein
MLYTFNNSCKKTIKLLLSNQKLKIAKKKNLKKKAKEYYKNEKMVKMKNNLSKNK